MKPTWLIEANVEGLPSESLQAVIRRQGMSVRMVKAFLHAEGPGDILGAEDVPLDACVLFTGTLPLMRYIQHHRRWIPGGWCNFDRLSCSKYYAYFGPFLVNRHYAMLPIAEAIREADHLFSSLGRDGKLFIRPDSVDKSFSGKLVDVDSFHSFLTPNATDPTLLVLVSEPQRLKREWRLFVAQSTVVTGSQYRLNGETNVASSIPREVIDFGNEVLSAVNWRPDPLFVMDVCESERGMRVVELNSFSCSGQCAIDLDKYVEVASEFASRAW